MSDLYTKLCTALQENNTHQVNEIILELNTLTDLDLIKKLQALLNDQSSVFLDKLAECKLPEHQKNELLFAAKRIKSYPLPHVLLTKRKPDEDINERPTKKSTTEQIGLEKEFSAYGYTPSQIETLKKLELLDALRDFHKSVTPLPGCDVLFLTSVNGSGKENLLNLKENISRLKEIGFSILEIEELMKHNECIPKVDYVVNNWKTVQQSNLSNFEIIRIIKLSNSIKSLQGIIEYLPLLRAMNCTRAFVKDITPETQGNKLKSTYKEIEALFTYNNAAIQNTSAPGTTIPMKLTYATVRNFFNTQTSSQPVSYTQKKAAQPTPCMKNVYQITDKNLPQENIEIKSPLPSELTFKNLAYSG